MARSYDLDHAHVSPGTVTTEYAVLTADVDGEQLCVERFTILCSSSAGDAFAVRIYEGGSQMFEWLSGARTANDLIEVPCPWHLLGSQAAPQELRVQKVAGAAFDSQTALEFSRE